MAKARYTLIVEDAQIIELDNGKTMVIVEEELENDYFELNSCNADYCSDLQNDLLWEMFDHRFDLITDFGEFVEFDEDTGKRVPTVGPLFNTD